MDIGSILMILAFFFLTVLFIAKPFLDSQRSGAGKPLLASNSAAQQSEQQHSVLLAERESVLMALQELETDYALAKMPEDEYLQQRGDLMYTGAAILKQLDQLSGADQPGAQKPAPSARTSARKMEDVEALLAARRQMRRQEKSLFCQNCGKPVQKEDRFCPNCGKKVGNRS